MPTERPDVEMRGPSPFALPVRVERHSYLMAGEEVASWAVLTANEPSMYIGTYGSQKTADFIAARLNATARGASEGIAAVMSLSACDLGKQHDWITGDRHEIVECRRCGYFANVVAWGSDKVAIDLLVNPITPAGAPEGRKERGPERRVRDDDDARRARWSAAGITPKAAFLGNTCTRHPGDRRASTKGERK